MYNFIGNRGKNIDFFQSFEQKHTPKEWFIAPLSIIEQFKQLILTGEMVKYTYVWGAGGDSGEGMMSITI